MYILHHLVFYFCLLILYVASLPQDQNNLLDLISSNLDDCDDNGSNNPPTKRIVDSRDTQVDLIAVAPPTQDESPTAGFGDNPINQAFSQGLKTNPHSTSALLILNFVEYRAVQNMTLRKPPTTRLHQQIRVLNSPPPSPKETLGHCLKFMQRIPLRWTASQLQSIKPSLPTAMMFSTQKFRRMRRGAVASGFFLPVVIFIIKGRQVLL